MNALLVAGKKNPKKTKKQNSSYQNNNHCNAWMETTNGHINWRR